MDRQGNRNSGENKNALLAPTETAAFLLEEGRKNDDGGDSSEASLDVVYDHEESSNKQKFVC